jgi:hypothetical protein
VSHKLNLRANLNFDEVRRFLKHWTAGNSANLAVLCSKKGNNLTRKSCLSIVKLLIYKTVIKPIWTYGIELWGCCPCKTNIAIIQGAQSKILRSITNAPWYVSNLTLHKDLKTPYVTETLGENSTRYYNKLENHSNPLLQPLLQPHENRRLKRNWPADLRN